MADARPRALAGVSLALAVGLAIAGCSSGLPPDNQVYFEDVPLPSQQQASAEQEVGRPEPGLSPLAVVSGFMRAMSALDQAAGGAWVAGDARPRVDGWAGASTIDVYARRSVVTWSQESGTAEVVLRVQRQGQLVGGADWRPAAGTQELTVELTRDGGEWRVANPPRVPLVAGGDFGRRFARAAVYFVARDGRHLTPQPTMLRVPEPGGEAARTGTQVVDSARALVERLLLGPRGDVAGALQTSIPRGTRVRDVSVADRVAVIDLTGQFAAPSGAPGRLRVGQVVWTVGQLFGVPQVELTIDGEEAQKIGPDRFDASGRWSPSQEPLEALLPSRQGSAETLLFTRDGQLTLLSIAGGDPVVVPVAPVGIVKSPTLSPDGSRIAFIVHAGASDTVWLSSADGGQARPTILTGTLSDPSWTPDGQQILVLRGGGGADQGRPAARPRQARPGTTLWSIRPSSPSRPRQLTLAPLPGGLEPTTLRVSPDGAFVLAVGAKPGAGFRLGGGGQLFRGRLTADGVAGWTASTITPGFDTVHSPVWAGVDKIAFIAKRQELDDPGAVWVMDSDGWRPEPVDLGADRNLNLGERLAADPRGDRFVFTVNSGSGSTELFTVLRLDATSLRPLTRAGPGALDTDPSLASR